MTEIHPKKIDGNWDLGFSLDQHTLSSTFIGYNELGHPEFDTVRSPLGELVYRLKYKADRKCLSEIVETISNFLTQQGIKPDVIVPMPPSRPRALQPVIAIAEELGRKIGVHVETTALRKTKVTQQMKDVGDFSQRVEVLSEAFMVTNAFTGKKVLLVDDLYQSGATMNVVAQLIKKDGNAAAVFAIAMTRTRS